MKDTRKHILEISMKLFLEKGFKEVTMNELVQSCGLSKGAFYHYFTSKDKLYQKAIEAYVDESFTYMSEVYDAQNTLRENVLRMVEAFSQMYEGQGADSDSKKRLLNSYVDMVRRSMQSDVLSKKMQAFMQMFTEQFNGYVKEAQEKGEIKKSLNAHHVTMHVLALLEGLNLIYPFSAEPMPITEFIADMLNQYFDLIQT